MKRSTAAKRLARAFSRPRHPSALEESDPGSGEFYLRPEVLQEQERFVTFTASEDLPPGVFRVRVADAAGYDVEIGILDTRKVS